MSSVIDKQLNEMLDLGDAQEMAMEVVRECNKEGASLEYK